MIELNKEELMLVNGGGFSGAIINSIIRGTNLIFELGRSFGTTIRRFVSRRYC